MAVDAKHVPPPPAPAAASATVQAGHPLQQTQNQPQQQHQDVESGRLRQSRQEVMASGGAGFAAILQAPHEGSKPMSLKRTIDLQTIVDKRGSKVMRTHCE